MTTFVGLHDDGKSSVQGFMDIFSGLFAAGVVKTGDTTSLQVVQRGAGANMSVDISAGKCLIDDTSFHYPCWSDAVENETVAAADPSNPRKDIVVAYVDHSVPTTSVTNNTGALKLKVVTGTAAASPTEPSSSAIQTSVGSGNPWIYLAMIDVAASSTTVVDANITDRRVDIALSATINPPDDSIDADAVDFGGDGSGVWWEEIGRTTLTSSADLITVSSLAAKRHIKVIVDVFDIGGDIDVLMTFNNDSASNYAVRTSDNGGADGTSVSRANIGLSPTAAQNAYAEYITTNYLTEEKIGHMVVSHQFTDGAASAPSRRIGTGKWADVLNQITRVDIANAQAGSFATGSQVIVLGHD